MNWTVVWLTLAFLAWLGGLAVAYFSAAKRPEGGRWHFVVFLCAANFFVFFLLFGLVGGTAVLGRRADGFYFVGDHGHLRQVKPLVYWYSFLHGVSQLVTLPLGVFAAFRAREQDADSEPRSSFRGRGAA